MLLVALKSAPDGVITKRRQTIIEVKLYRCLRTHICVSIVLSFIRTMVLVKSNQIAISAVIQQVLWRKNWKCRPSYRGLGELVGIGRTLGSFQWIPNYSSVPNYAIRLYHLLGIPYIWSFAGPYSLSGRTSYQKISWNLEAMWSGFKLFQAL